MRKRDLNDLTVEIISVAMIIAGLGNQLDKNETDTLSPSAMNDALFGIQTHLMRISDDLDSINRSLVEGGAKC